MSVQSLKVWQQVAVQTSKCSKREVEDVSSTLAIVEAKCATFFLMKEIETKRMFSSLVGDKF